MKTKTLLITIMIAVFPFLLEAQLYSPLPKFYQPIDSATIAKNKQKRMHKGETDFGVTMGTGFSSFAGGVMNSYIAPNMKYQLTEDFRLDVGTVISTTNSGLMQGGGFQANSNSPNNFGFSGRGVYTPTEKLSISFSGAYMEYDNAMQPFNRYPQQNNQMNYKSMSFGLGYQISENASINFEFGYSNGGNGLYSPYNNSFHSPFSPHNTQPFFW